MNFELNVACSLYFSPLMGALYVVNKLSTQACFRFHVARLRPLEPEPFGSEPCGFEPFKFKALKLGLSQLGFFQLGFFQLGFLKLG